MTIAVCVRCGAQKYGAFVDCEACTFLPRSEHDLIHALALTDHHMPVKELDRIGEEIRNGVLLDLPPEQQEMLRPAIREHQRIVGKVIAAAWDKKRGERRSRIAAALKAAGIASKPTDDDTQFCISAAADIAVAVMKKTGITQDTLAPDQTAVGGVFAMIAAEVLSERLGGSVNEIGRAAVATIIMRWLPPGLPKAFADEVRAQAAPLTAQVTEVYSKDRRTARVVGQLIAAWLADGDTRQLEKLASVFAKARERIRVVGGDSRKVAGSSPSGPADAGTNGITRDGKPSLLDWSDPAVKELIKSAKVRGYVTLDQLNAVLPPREFSPEQIEEILSVLDDMGITVVESDDDVVPEERRDAPVQNESGKKATESENRILPADAGGRLAICVRCGARKPGAFAACTICSYIPHTEDELIRSLAFSDKYLDIALLDGIRDQIQRGQQLEVPKGQAETLRPIAQAYMTKFGAALAAVSEKREVRKDAFQLEASAALKTVGIALEPTHDHIQFCIRASSRIAAAVMQKVGIDLRNPSAEDALVGCLFGLVATDYVTQRVGGSFELISTVVVPTILAPSVPANLSGDAAEALAGRMASLTGMAIDVFNRERQTAEIVGKGIAAWLANPHGDGLNHLASLFMETKQRIRPSRGSGASNTKNDGAITGAKFLGFVAGFGAACAIVAQVWPTSPPPRGAMLIVLLAGGFCFAAGYFASAIAEGLWRSFRDGQ